MIKCISQETQKEFLIPYLQKNYHTLCGYLDMFTDINENYTYEEIIPTMKDYWNNRTLEFVHRKED